MSAPKLVATDLDGTLLRDDGTVSERTARVLRRLDDAGVPVVFVTGRPIRWMEAVRAHVGALGLVICSNGAVVAHLADERVELIRPIPDEVLLRVAADLRAALPAVRFALEDRVGFAMEPDFPVRGPRPPDAAVAPLEGLVGRGPVLKLLARVDGGDPDGVLAAAVAAVGGRAEVTRSEAVPMVEISGPGVTKATTVAIVCERLGIDAADVVAFGDMPNDRAVLAWAGRSFAVAGAHPSLDEVVTDHAGDNDDDGVAIALEGLFDLR